MAKGSILALLLLISCGHQKDAPMSFISPTDEVEYLRTEFEMDGLKYSGMIASTAHVNITFVPNLPYSWIGVCNSYPNGARHIQLRQDWWNSAPADSRRSLLYHELGHCALNREHNNIMYRNRKLSVMNGIIVSGFDLKNLGLYHGYMSELFTGDSRLLQLAIDNLGE